MPFYGPSGCADPAVQPFFAHGKFIWHYLVISKATAGEKHPQSGSQGACGSKNDPEATPEYKKMEKNSEKTAFFTFWPLWAK